MIYGCRGNPFLNVLFLDRMIPGGLPCPKIGKAFGFQVK